MKQKGSRYERELAKQFCDSGIAAKANGQPKYVSGVDHGSDILLRDYGYYIEAKRCEQLRIVQWLAKAEAEAEQRDEQPVLIFRQNHQESRVIISLEHFIRLHNVNGIPTTTFSEMMRHVAEASNPVLAASALLIALGLTDETIQQVGVRLGCSRQTAWKYAEQAKGVIEDSRSL